MIKRRPVIVVSPKISIRYRLCTVVPLSTKAPHVKMPYHCELDIQPPLPPPFTGDNWVKADMICAVSFDRLDFIRLGKTPEGKRIYRKDVLSPQQIQEVRGCILKGLGLAALTIHL